MNDLMLITYVGDSIGFIVVTEIVLVGLGIYTYFFFDQAIDEIGKAGLHMYYQLIGKKPTKDNQIRRSTEKKKGITYNRIFGVLCFLAAIYLLVRVIIG